MTDNNSLPGWYRDPSGLGEGRYWDGAFWTSSVIRSGVTIDVPIESEHAALPPVPGSELRPAAPEASVRKRSPLGAIVGVLVVILMIVVVVVVLNGDDSSNDETPPATNPSATEAPPATTG